MTYDLLIKEASLSGIVSSILEQVKGMVDFKNRPFETIFGIMGTGLSWSFGPMIGMLTTASELVGFGPGYIGSLIDKHFGFGASKTIDNVKFSQSNVEAAAESTSGDLLESLSGFPDKLKSWLKSIFASTLSDIKELKGDLNSNDIHTAFYMSMYSNPIIKTAKIGVGLKAWRRFAGLFRGGKTGKVMFTGVLMKLIWMFVKGLLALGIGGGVASMVGVRTQQQKRVDEQIGTSEKTNENLPHRPAGLKHYSNVNHDVKQTLITFLNATIANFSNGFMQAQRLANPSKAPVSVEQAPGWTQVLAIIQKYNWAPLEEVNGFSAFVGPNIQKIAQLLLYSVKVSGVKIEKMEPKTNMPMKPTMKTPKVQPTISNEDRLKQLLQGEART